MFKVYPRKQGCMRLTVTLLWTFLAKSKQVKLNISVISEC